MKKHTLWLALGTGLIVLSLLVIGTVSAWGPKSSPERSTQQEVGPCHAWGEMEAGGRAGRTNGRRGFGNQGASDKGGLISITAESLGLSSQDVLQALEEGKTLRELIEEKGGDPEEIVAKFISARQEVIEQLVSEGRLSQEQAEQMLSHLEEEAYDHLDSFSPQHERGPQQGHKGECAGECEEHSEGGPHGQRGQHGEETSASYQGMRQEGRGFGRHSRR
ncbi:MAG: hypothetical protein J7M05_03855 [Anaerolineae bacterium]|nr:hypothetical protein [Anaerolineae bacterium]